MKAHRLSVETSILRLSRGQSGQLVLIHTHVHPAFWSAVHRGDVCLKLGSPHCSSVSGDGPTQWLTGRCKLLSCQGSSKHLAILTSSAAPGDKVQHGSASGGSSAFLPLWSQLPVSDRAVLSPHTHISCPRKSRPH